MSKVLNNSDDFYWYKKGLDVAAKYKHDHFGTPEKYPCKVVSEFKDNPNGAYEYWHDFIYEQEVKCECCGHVSVVWPKLPEE